MSEQKQTGISEQELSALENQVESLIEACAYLKDENRALRAKQDKLQSERSDLAEKNEQARSRVDAIISRLKSLETNT